MIETIRNSGPRLDQPLQDDAQPVGRTGRHTASGISSLQGTVPPSTASASPSVALAFAPTSKVAATVYDGAVDGAAGRFAAAASALDPAIAASGDAGLALSPLDAARALFKAALESNNHQQDDALQKRKDAMEVARGKELAQAAQERAAAKDIDSNSWKQFGAAATAAGAGLAASKWNNDWLLAGSKVLDARAQKYGAATQADTKIHDAEGHLAASDAAAANSQKADANDLTERLRQQFQQLFQALSEMRAEKANQLRALV